MYGRVLLSVVLPFFLIAAGFGYALEVRQHSDPVNVARRARQAAAQGSSPAGNVVRSDRGKAPVATSARANEPDGGPMLLDSRQANEYTAGGGIGSLMNVVANPTRQNTADTWVDSVVAVKPADFITFENDINQLLVNTADLRPYHRNLYLPTASARPPVTAASRAADEVNTVPEPATGLLLAIGACAIIRKRRRRPRSPE
jgi:hypothetical protein